MRSAAKATKVLDAYLAARASTASDAAFVCCREVIGSLRAYVEAEGAAPIDDLTARRLALDRGLEPSGHELAAVLAVIEHVPDFFKHQVEVGGPATDLAEAADVVRSLAGWLMQRRLIDADVALHLGRYTQLFDGDQRTGT